MKNTIINEIILKMQTKLNNGQLEELKKTLEQVLLSYDMMENSNIEDKNLSNQNFIELFLAAKKIEGCSIKSSVISVLGSLRKHLSMYFIH